MADKNKQIHIFIAHMGIGGAERVCVNLANEWARRGYEVNICVLNLDNDINTGLLDKSVKVHELGVSRLRYAPLPMLRYIKKNKPEFMFVFGNEMAVIINKLKQLKLTGVKVVVRVLNNVNISLSKEDNVSPLVENYLKSAQKQLADMDYVIAQCKDMRDMVVKKGIVQEDKIRVVYNPVSSSLIERVDKLRAQRTNSGNGYRVAFIGRVDPQKQPLMLIEAWARVHRQLPEAVLEIVGDGSLMEQTKAKVDELGLTQSVIFDGVRKDMENVYSVSDAVILSSQYEGMPNVLIEAIGCGIPVVSFDCPIGPAEIIEDGVNGFLVEQDNVDMLAEKTVLALKQSWDSDIIKSTCRKFDVRNIADTYEEIWKSL